MQVGWTMVWFTEACVVKESFKQIRQRKNKCKNKLYIESMLLLLWTVIYYNLFSCFTKNMFTKDRQELMERRAVNVQSTT